MRPANLNTKIFLDSGDPADTREVLEFLGFLDGQTTNPSLIARHPQVVARLNQGQPFTRPEIYAFYRSLAQEISALIPDGSVSLEVYLDSQSKIKDVYDEGIMMYGWIPNAHIKLPITRTGLSVARKFVKENVRVNLTLCFSQPQAAAAYSATSGAQPGDIFLSPFIGRLDDIGQNGLDLLAHILKIYRQSDHHVQVLAASIRTIDHFMTALKLGADIITAPKKILRQWADMDKMLPDTNWLSPDTSLKPINFQTQKLNLPLKEYDIKHELTDQGLAHFVDDWNRLIK